ncbi:winged helix-turn-helix transcriptional regulator [Salimicrobium halophilum]|uniref:DNA-binding transcriptional regulator, HxlR family n=1 Tax=Salimicrobium halophilum TaxID=86666 RepID=A0A1G8UW73_9BACI|nr:helix-turn-helix domain-containing protein [Salimicrobium halophilum]SDJ57807.1 DNA-binding transcriptional regulator, HxlR family [Salimicrobium halophilum]
MDTSKICPKFEKAMSILSKRWTGLVIYQLMEGPQRFCTIESSVGISGRLLSDRLKHLENEGIVKREVFPETPVRIEYSLTEKGKDMEPLMKELESWSGEWIKEEETVEN